MGRAIGLLSSLTLGAAVAVVAPSPSARAEVVTVVSIQFDDGNADQFTARDALAARGMHATFYVNTGPVGGAGHLSWDQLDALGADGHEITGHTVDHGNLKRLKAPELRHQVCDDRATLQAHGFAAVSFAYPFGGFDPLAQQIVAECGYTSGRGVSGVDGRRTFAETLPPAAPYATRTPANVKSGTTLATIQSYITGAEDHGGGWVQLVFHHVCDRCDAYSVTLADLTALLDWLAARAPQGTIVRTTAEAMAMAPAP